MLHELTYSIKKEEGSSLLLLTLSEVLLLKHDQKQFGIITLFKTVYI